MDTRLALMCGVEYPIPELQIAIHQPRVKEIAYIGFTIIPNRPVCDELKGDCH